MTARILRVPAPDLILWRSEGARQSKKVEGRPGVLVPGESAPGPFQHLESGNFEKMSWIVATANQQITFKRDDDGKYRSLVFDNLVDEKFEPYLPLCRKTFYEGRHRNWKPEQVFGRYVFVRFDERWPGVSEVRGICSVLKPSWDLVRKPRDKNDATVLPFLVDDSVIAKWKARERDGFIADLEGVRAMLISLAALSGIRIVDAAR
jgi:hypothetical protein